ncbi:tRNA 2-selenouridine synthase [Campylobacterota bacterium]|nr:tRNA 2-selenouridine synthase [Campylobacterota bacterium]
MCNEISASDFLAKRSSFDAVFDVRSPLEYAAACVPHSTNFYALDDEQRVDVGTLYVRTPLEARVLGASYICKNLADHLAGFASRYTPAHRIAIYCARGGLRSSSVATVLGNIGYRIWRITGGFKAYRNEILSFYQTLPPYRFVVLDGNTGSGKSELILALERSIDLEGMARHKGSAFGEILGAQPKTMKFENELHFELTRLGSLEAIAIEAESRTIGRVTTPASVYAAMQAGKRVWIDCSIDDRIKRTVREYGAISQEFFDRSIARITPLIARTVLKEIRESFAKRDLETCAFLLLTEYYDKVYKKPPHIDAVVRFDTLANACAELEAIRQCV